MLHAWLIRLFLGLLALSVFAVGVGPANAATTKPPLKVAVGFYAMTLQGLDQQDNSYYADFYMWMRWRGAGADPSATFEFMNNIERWGLTQTPVYEEPKTLPTGELTQQFHVQGKFFAPLDLTTYPLDDHELPIEIEDSGLDSTGQLYVMDKAESGLDPAVQIPGWNITGTTLNSSVHKYGTTFGESAKHDGSVFSRATFAVAIERPPNFFIWKLFLPLMIVMLVAISVLLVHPTLVEVRLAAPVTALLALVFLQQAYSDTLPENGNLVLLDKIYVLSYALIVGLIVTTLLTAHWTSSDDSSVRDVKQAARWDRWIAGTMVAIFGIGSAVLIATA